MSEQIESRLSFQIEQLNRQIELRRNAMANQCDSIIDRMERVKRQLNESLTLNSCGEIQGSALTLDLMAKEICMLVDKRDELLWIQSGAPLT